MYFGQHYWGTAYWGPSYWGGGVAEKTATDFPGALWTALSDVDSVTALFGKSAGGVGGWLQWQKGKALLPYAVLLPTIDIEPDALAFGARRVETTQAQIPIYARTKTQANALALAILAALDDEPESPEIPPLEFLGGYERARFPKDPTFAEEDPDPGPDGETVWVVRVVIDFMIVRRVASASA